VAFPVVQARNANASTGNSAGAYTATLPASIAAGELLVAAISNDGIGALTYGSGLAGWNVLFSSFSSGAGLTFFYKVAVGGEGTLSVAGPAENFIGRTLRLTGYDPNLPPAFATATATTTNPDPPVLDPADWATEDTLWLAIASGDCTAAAGTISAAPTNYTTNASLQTSTDATTTNRVVQGFGERSLNAGSENPGTFTRAQSDNYLAATVAIRTAPAAPLQPILASTGFYSASGTAPTNSFTQVAGSNRRLMVSVMTEAPTVSSMTYGGVSMALVTDGTNTAASTNTARTEWWTLREASLPANGANNLVVNLSATGECYINAILVGNTDQATNVDEVNNANTAAATTVTTTVTVNAAGSLILSASNKNNNPHFTNFTVGGVRAMGRGSCSFPTGGAFMMNVAREVTATGSTSVVSTCESIRQVMSTVMLNPAVTATAALTGVPFTGSGAGVAKNTGTAALTGVPFTGSGAGTAGSFGTISFVDWDHDVQQGAPATSVVATMPPLAAVGDYIVVFITTTQDGTPNTPTTNGVPWTFLGSQVVGTTTTAPECAAYGRFKIVGDPSTVTFTNGLSSGSGYGLTAQSMAFSGVNTTTPIDTTATTSSGTAAPPDPASITTVTPNCMIVAIGFMDGDTGTLVKSSGYTDPIGTVDTNSGGGADNGSRATVCYKALTSAGAENPGVYTTNTNASHGSITIALRPASGGAGSVDGTAALTGVPFTGSGTGVAKIEATAALTSVPFTGSGTGTAKVAATMALTGVPFTGSGTGVAKLDASLALTGVPFTGTGVGRGTFAATMALTGVPFTGAGTGVNSVLGTLGLTGVPFTGAGSGVAKNQATLALTGVPFTGSGTGVAKLDASLALTGVPFTGAGTGAAKVAGTLALMGVPFTGAGTGTAKVEATVALTGVPFTGLGTGVAKLDASLALTGVPFTGSGVGRGTFAADLALTGVPFTGSGVGSASNNPTANLALTGVPFTGSGAGVAKVEGTLATTGVPFAGAGTGQASTFGTLGLTGVPFAGSGTGVAKLAASLALTGVPFAGSGVGVAKLTGTLALTGVPFTGSGAGIASQVSCTLALTGVPFTGSGSGTAINLYEATLALTGIPFTGSGSGHAGLALVDPSAVVTVGGPELVVEPREGASLAVSILGAAVSVLTVVALLLNVTVGSADVTVVVEANNGD
jgi:hypothetical protein